jgi:ABC-2 type transport system ATP-binding protein
MSFGVRSVTVRFGDRTALQDVTVEAPAGSVVAVVGGDGAGKTTLLRTLVREIRPAAGAVRAPGKDQLGYLPASSGSWAALTVAQNIDFVGGIHGLAGRQLTARRDALLEASGLTAAAGRPAAALSGGMRRKLGFCLAIVHTPELLVLDEPTTGVDPVSRIDLWRLVSEAAAAGTAVVMTTTYLDEAERAARLLVLDRGRAVVQGSYDDVIAGFTGTVTTASTPVRPDWSWRRGAQRREYWPSGGAPAGATRLSPDLEDVVIARSLLDRNAAPAGSSA